MRLIRYFALLPIVLIACSCGGGGGSSSVTGASDLVSTYRSDFTRGAGPNTTLMLFIDVSGHVGAQISNGATVEWAGIGSANGSTLTVTLQPVDSSVAGTVLCQGTIVPGAPPTLNVTLSGAVADSFSATQFSGAGVLPYSGNYDGDGEGSEKQTFTYTISDGGHITGTLNSPTLGDNIAMEGTVSLDGHVDLHAQAFTVAGEYTGYMFLAPGTGAWRGNGTWELNDLQGEWTATTAQAIP